MNMKKEKKKKSFQWLWHSQSPLFLLRYPSSPPRATFSRRYEFRFLVFISEEFQLHYSRLISVFLSKFSIELVVTFCRFADLLFPLGSKHVLRCICHLNYWKRVENRKFWSGDNLYLCHSLAMGLIWVIRLRKSIAVIFQAKN